MRQSAESASHQTFVKEKVFVFFCLDIIFSGWSLCFSFIGVKVIIVIVISCFNYHLFVMMVLSYPFSMLFVDGIYLFGLIRNIKFFSFVHCQPYTLSYFETIFFNHLKRFNRISFRRIVPWADGCVLWKHFNIILGFESELCIVRRTIIAFFYQIL